MTCFFIGIISFEGWEHNLDFCPSGTMLAEHAHIISILPFVYNLILLTPNLLTSSPALKWSYWGNQEGHLAKLYLSSQEDTDKLFKIVRLFATA